MTETRNEMVVVANKPDDRSGRIRATRRTYQKKRSDKSMTSDEDRSRTEASSVGNEFEFTLASHPLHVSIEHCRERRASSAAYASPGRIAMRSDPFRPNHFAWAMLERLLSHAVAREAMARDVARQARRFSNIRTTWEEHHCFVAFSAL